MRRGKRMGMAQNRFSRKFFLSVREKDSQSQTHADCHHRCGVDPRLPPERKPFFHWFTPNCSQDFRFELGRRFILADGRDKESSECSTFLQERLARWAVGQMPLHLDLLGKIEFAVQIGIYEVIDFVTLHFTIPWVELSRFLHSDVGALDLAGT